MEYEKEV